MSGRKSRRARIEVGAPGNLPYDPSENVLALVKAAVKRIDDLADERQQAFRREFDIRAEHQRAMAALRAEHAAENLKSEARRIDALRELDRVEVRTGTERHQAAVDALAKTTATMADTLRSSAENMARNIAAQSEASRKEMDARLSALEKLQAAGSGKGAGLNAAWVYLGGLVALLVGLYALGSKFFGH